MYLSGLFDMNIILQPAAPAIFVNAPKNEF
jgi:hypothetical protein